MVDSWVAAVVANVLMSSMTVVAEFATISVISIGLLIMDWKIALATFVYLGLIALLLSRVVTPKAVRNGAVNRDNSIRVVRLLGEEIGRAHVRTPVTWPGRMPSSAPNKK